MGPNVYSTKLTEPNPSMNEMIKDGSKIFSDKTYMHHFQLLTGHCANI